MTALTATVSLLQNNLTCSSGGWLASAHNSVQIGGGKILLHHLPSNSSRDGPEVNQATSVRFLELSHGPVLCVSSTNGTQIYNEDATTLLFFMPINDATAEPDVLKHHQGACVVPTLQHIVIGTSKGTLAIVAAVAPNYHALAEPAAASPMTNITDVCFLAAANAVVSAHSNSEIRFWTPGEQYVNQFVMQCHGQAPVRVASLGMRLLVACGPGTICLYDALSHELQVELTAHARWITAVDVREDIGQLATVGEDTVLNVWQVEPTQGKIYLQHSSVVTDKLLSGACFTSVGAAITAYDSDELFHVAF